MKPDRAKQRITHAIDNIGGRDLPHAAVHLEDAAKAKSLKEVKDHIKRAAGHIKSASEQSRLLSDAIQIIPGVVKEANRLKKAQAKSDGLLHPEKAVPLKDGVRKSVARKKASKK